MPATTSSVSVSLSVCDAERWESLWKHRDSLLRVARRRVTDPSEAEDVVSEAIVRAAADGSVVIETAGAWMNRVVMNLCADRHREMSYERNRLHYAVRHAIPVASPEEEVCDRAEAAAVERHVLTPPERQRRAVLLRAAGHDITAIAAELDSEYKAVESLLSRARRSLRTVGAAVIAVVSVVRGWGRGTRVAVTAAAAVTVVTLGASTVPGPSPHAVADPAPTRVAPAEAVVPPSRDGAVGLSRTGSTLEGSLRVTADADREVRGAARGRGARSRRLVEEQRVAGPVGHATTPAVVERKPDEPFLTSLRDCVSHGIVVKPHFVGCRSAD